jgi:hypothetical protein
MDYFVRFDVFMAARMMMFFFWVLAPCRLGFVDGDSMFLRNVDIY